MYWQNISCIGSVISRCVTCSVHYPLPNTGSCNCPNWLGGGTEREVKGEDCQGGGGRVGGVKVKGQFCSGSCCHLSGQAENEKSTCSAEWPRIANG